MIWNLKKFDQCQILGINTENRMQTQILTKPETRKHKGLIYIIFLITGLINLINKDLTAAIIFLALAMGSIPFNVNNFSNGMPLYQQVLIILHVLVVIGLIVLMLSGT